MRCALLLATLVLVISAVGQQQEATRAAAADARDSKPAEVRVQCISPQEAAAFIGQNRCIAGKVSRISERSGNTYVAFRQPANRRNFHGIVLAQDRQNVGDLSMLHGKVIIVLGEITNRHGQPTIIVKSPEQFRITSGPAPAQFDASRRKPMNTGQYSTTKHVREY